jgi:CDP-diacylglycerol--glycerol-3-phosphate 3-phosphatidyltransferase
MKFLPNILTLSRLFGSFLVAVLIFKGFLFPAWIFFTLFALTDFLDGYIARKFSVKTDFGRIVDPIADKFLVNLTAISLWKVGKILGIFVISVLLRDFVLIIGGLLLIVAGKTEKIKPSMLGKLTTLFQFITIFYSFSWESVKNLLVCVTVIFTAISCIQYTVRGIKVLFKEK